MKTYKDFFEDVKRGNIKKIMIFRGEDYYLMKRVWEFLSEKLNARCYFFITDDLKTSDKRNEFLKKFSESDIFVSQKKIFIIYLPKIPAYMKGLLLSVEKINAENFLILVVNDEKNVSLLSPPVLKDIEFYYFPEVNEEDALKWISREFARNGKIISPRTARFIYEVSEGKLGKIKNIVEIISLGFENKSIPLPDHIAEFFKRRFSFEEFIKSLNPGEKIENILSLLYKVEFSEYEINSLLNVIARKLYNNKNNVVEENMIYDIIYELCLLQREIQTKMMNKKFYFLNKISEILLKKEVDFGISGTY